MDYFVFSDIHGQKELFDKICSWLNGRSEPWECYFLGDACDRGEFGYSIIKALLADDRFIYMKGNHEDLFSRAAKQLKQRWLEDGVTKAMAAADPETYIMNYYWYDDIALHIQNGGLSTLMAWAADGSPMDIIGKLDRLPKHIILPNEVWGSLDLSHAGHLIDESDDLIWSREHFDEKWTNGRMIHGHTPVRSLMRYGVIINPAATSSPAFYQDGTKICIDTGCFITEVITLLNLNTFEQHRFYTDSILEAIKGE